MPEARNVFGAPCSNLRSFGSKCTVLKTKPATLLGLFRRPPVIPGSGQCSYRYAAGVALRDKVRSCEICGILNAEPLL